MNEITGFKSVEEIFKEAESIGDVTTPEGKNRIMTFLYKSLMIEQGYSFQTTLPNGLKGKFEGTFSVDVKNAIYDAFDKFKKTTQIPPKEYYFENNKLRSDRDESDSIIGNSFVSLSATVYYGYSRIKRYFGEKTTMKKYTEEEVIALETSCREYIKQKEITK